MIYNICDIIYAHAYVHMYVYMMYTCKCTHTCTYVYTYLYIYIHTCVYTYTDIHIHICEHICMCIYIYTYTHIQKDIYIEREREKERQRERERERIDLRVGPGRYIIYIYIQICTYTHVSLLFVSAWPPQKHANVYRRDLRQGPGTDCNVQARYLFKVLKGRHMYCTAGFGASKVVNCRNLPGDSFGQQSVLWFEMCCKARPFKVLPAPYPGLAQRLCWQLRLAALHLTSFGLEHNL